MQISDDMVERAARAMYCWTMRKKQIPWAYVKDWHELGEAYRREWREIARAALRAALWR